ncbi:MAG: CopD family protein [Thermoflexaceae bacterium]|nr:CopD family protein [Thermoflexaceae bacterium]
MPTDLDTWLHIIYAYLHDISIAVYIGGAVAMEFVLGPAQGSIPPAQAQVMGQKTADRFLWLVWGSLSLIIVTAFFRLQHMGYITSDWPFFESGLALSEDYGRTIWTMFALWCVLCVNGAIMTFYLRPRLAGRLKAGTTSAGVQASQQAKMEAAKWIERITRADLVIAVFIALLGASLKWGGLL